MKLYWLSWNQNADPQHGLDSRPVAWPPPDPVLAFWESGFGDDYTTVVALVRAHTEDDAQRVIERAWSPGVGKWRFCDEYGDESKPPSDRFQAPEWSVEMKRWPWRAS